MKTFFVIIRYLFTLFWLKIFSWFDRSSEGLAYIESKLVRAENKLDRHFEYEIYEKDDTENY